jgi:hypothetical protein
VQPATSMTRSRAKSLGDGDAIEVLSLTLNAD